MFEKFITRYRYWKKWASWNLGGPMYKIFVLFGIEKSAIFETATLPLAPTAKEV